MKILAIEMISLAALFGLSGCDGMESAANNVERTVDDKMEELDKDVHAAYVKVHDDVNKLHSEIKESIDPETRNKLRSNLEDLRKAYEDSKRRAAGLGAKARDGLKHIADEIEDKMADIKKKLDA